MDHQLAMSLNLPCYKVEMLILACTYLSCNIHLNTLPVFAYAYKLQHKHVNKGSHLAAISHMCMYADLT